MADFPLSPLERFRQQQSSEAPSFELPSFDSQPSENSQRRPSTGNVPQDLMPAFQSSSERYGVPSAVLLALAEQESNFNARALGPETQWGRAKGIMQNLDSTAAGLGINPYDPVQSIDAAAKQIRERLDKGYSMIDAVREHFAGPNRKLWGTKTERYGLEVMQKAERYGQLNGAPQQQPTQQGPQQPEQPQSQRAFGDSGIPYMPPEQARNSRLDEIEQRMDRDDARTIETEAPGFLANLRDVGLGLGVGMDNLALNTRELVGRIPGVGDKIVSGLDAVDEFISGKPSDELLRDSIERRTESMTPEMQEALQKRWWDSEENRPGDAWTDWRSYSGGLVQSIPETAVSMLPAIRIAKASYASSLARGATQQVAAANAARSAAIAGSLIEGGLGGASVSREVRDAINELPDEVLAQSDTVQRMIADSGGTLDLAGARRQLAEDQASKAFLVGGALTGAFGGQGDRVLARIITENMSDSAVRNTINGAVRGMVSEGLLEEAPQEVSQQLVQNWALMKADPSQELSEDLINAGMGGAVLGGIMGGGIGGTAGATRRTDQQQAPSDAELEALRSLDPNNQPASQSAPAPALAPAGPVSRAVSEAPVITEPQPEAQQEPQQPSAPLPFEPGTPVQIETDGIDPVLTQYQGEQQGAALFTDDAGNSYAIPRDEIDSGAVRVSPVQQADAASAPIEQPTEQADPAPEPASDRPAAPVREVERKEPTPIAQMDEQQLDERMDYLRRQARNSGWDRRLTEQRDAVEARMAELQPAQQEAQPEQQAEPEQTQAEGETQTREPVKWFGNHDKANEWVARQQDSERYVVEPNGRRFEIYERDQQASEGSAPTAEQAPKPAPKRARKKAEPGKPSPHQNRARKLMGADVGDIVSPSGNVGYASGGGRYEITSIARNGEVQLRNVDTGAGTSWSRAELEGASHQGVSFEKSVREAKTKDAQPEQGDGQAARTEKPRPRIGDPDYSLLDARNDLIEMRSEVEAQGMVADARLMDRVRRQEKLVREMADDRQPSKDQANAVDQWQTQADEALANVPSDHPMRRKWAASVRNGLRSAGDRESVLSAMREAAERETTSADQAPQESAPAPAASTNTIFTEDAAEKARAVLRSKLSQFNSGIDPEIMQAGITLAGYHIEKGARTFAAYARAMVEDMGEGVKPYLKSWYLGTRYDPRAASFEGMSSAAEVDEADVDALTEITNEVQPEQPAERPSGADTAAQPESVPADRSAGRDGENAGRNEPSVSGDAGNTPRRSRKRRENAGEPAVSEEPGQGSASADSGVQSSGQRRDTTVSRADRQSREYRIEPGELSRSGSWRDTAEQNVGIVELVKEIDRAGRPATREEQARLTKFTGWGAGEIANNIFPDAQGNYRSPKWAELGERLKAALTPEEYAQARRTTQYAHYTSEPVIRSIYKGLNRMGFAGGAVLEPGMGVGLFKGLMPANMPGTYTGVEYDGITGRIAELLYPDSNIIVGDFAQTKLPADFFDAAIGNPPFSQTKVTSDPEYRQQSFMLHDYFFAKTIDRVKPGGLVTFITSKGTMDKTNDRARKYLAERANLVGAIRLPQTAFKANAGTEVVTDVLFLQKRGEGIEDNGVSWLGTKEVATPQGAARINEYFADNPGMVLGKNALSGSMYRANEYTVEPDGRDIEQAFADVVQTLPEGIYRPERGSRAEQSAVIDRDFNPTHQKEGGVYLRDGKLQIVEDGSGVPLTQRATTTGKLVDLKPRELDWLQGYVGVRDALKQAQLDQLTDGNWQGSLAELNRQYDAFTKKHGPILAHTVTERENQDGSTTVIRRFKNNPLLDLDVESPLVYAIEEIKPDGSIEKAPSLNGRTLEKPKEAKIQSTQDALFVSLNRNGRLDIDNVAELSGIDRDAVIEELGDLIYNDPATGWVMADEYLSGDVVKKLKEAEAAANVNRALSRNVEALRTVQPRQLAPADITVQLGSHWVPSTDVSSFASEVMGQKVRVTYSPTAASWEVTGGNTNPSEWRTEKRTAADILDAVLNNRQIKITWRDDEGKTYTDTEASEAANNVAKKMRAAFKSWLWTDKTRAERLTTFYNENFNNIVPREFDGSHLTLPGVSTRFDLYPHQKRAIWRAIQTGDTYMAHSVGAGKAQPLDAKILTPNGWKLMGDIKPGDMVITQSGKPTMVEAVFPQGDKEIYRVAFSDGSSTECCDEHLWLTYTYAERNAANNALRLGKEWECAKPQVRQLSEIRETLNASHLGAKNHSIPMVEPVEFEQQLVPLDPYLIGALIGDGHIGEKAVSITGADHEVIYSLVIPDGVHLRKNDSDDRCTSWHFIGTEWRNNPVLTACRDLGLAGKVSHEKFVPDVYKFNDTQVRLAVLKGLMDTDGTVSKRGHSASFSTVSNRLADDIAFLVQSLGGTAKISTKKTAYTHNGERKNGRLAYNVSVSMPANVNPFHIGRKAGALIPKTKYKPTRYIVGVKPIGRKAAQCIRVSDPSHLYVTDDFIVTHNTFTMIAAGMEERRLGLVNKPMYVVPNHMLAQFSKEFLELYPTANIMVADEKNFHTRNRQRFVAQASLNDPDAIVITHSAFGLIGMSDDFSTRFIQNQIDEMRAVLEEADSDDRLTRKQIEQRIEQLENRVKAKQGSRKDKALTFEEMGVDRLYVDEAHEFRKLDFATNRSNVKGIDPSGSMAAMDLFMKVQYLRERAPNRALVAASGTPITNTMGELFTVQRLFQPDQLEADGLARFDAWSNHFGEVVDGFEQNAAGGYQIVSRFARFVNVADLMSRVRSFMDVLTSEQLGSLVQRPSVAGGSREIVVTPTPDGYKAYQQELSDRITAIQNRSGPPQPGDDIILNVISDGRFSAIDMRFVDPKAPSDPNSKLNRMLDDVLEAYNSTADNEYRTGSTVDENTGGNVIVFTDIGLGEQSAQTRGFNMKAWMRKRLIDGGVNPDHIAFMRDNKAHAKKERLFSDMRSGKKRILIGGKDMETGVNVQKRLTHLYHLDAPWFPAAVEQREGRIVRQGNQNQGVAVKAYATKGSYDSSMWGMIARKSRFIEQAMAGDSSLRTMDDVSESSSFEMASALASGDERYLRLAGLKSDVERLSRLYSAHLSEQRNLASQKRSTESRIAHNQRITKELSTAVDKRQVIAAGEFQAKVDNATFDSREEFAAALFDAFKARAEAFTEGEAKLGSIGGFDIVFNGMTLRGSGDYSADLSVDLPSNPEPLAVFPIDPAMSVTGMASRAANQVNRLDRDLTEAQQSMDDAKRRLTQIESRLGAPFAEADELSEKQDALNALEIELSSETVAEDAEKQDGEQGSYSVGEDVATHDRQAIVDSLTTDPVVQELMMSGKLTVHETADSIPGGRRDRVRGFTDINGRIHINAANVTPASARAVLLHEAFHAGTPTLVGDKRWKNLTARLGGMYRNAKRRRAAGDPHPFWNDVLTRVEAAGETEFAAEEFGAYAVENYAQAPAGIKQWVDNLVGAVKAWAMRRFGIQAGAVTPAQLRSLAKAGLGAMSRTTNQTAMNASTNGLYSVMGNNTPTDKQVEGWWGRRATQVTPATLAVLPLDRMVNEVGKNIQAASQYLKIKRSMDAYRNTKHNEYNDTAQRWLKLNTHKNRKTVKELADLMHESTIVQVDPSKPFEPMATARDRNLADRAPESPEGKAAVKRVADDVRREEAHADLTARYRKLPEEFRSMYREVRDSYASQAKELDDIILENVEKSLDLQGRKAERTHEKEMQRIRDDGLKGDEKDAAIAAADKKLNTAKTTLRWNKRARMMQLRQQFEGSRLQGPYFPLARFGDYFVTARNAEGEVVSFYRRETPDKQQEVADQLRKEGWSVQTGYLSNRDEVRGAVDPNFVADVEDILADSTADDAVKDQIWQRFLETMPEFSMRKGFIHRKSREGYDSDALRAFSSKSFHGAHQMARLKFGQEMAEQIDIAREQVNEQPDPTRAGMVVNEIEKRHDFVMNPTGAAWAQRMTSAAFIYYLSVSPAAAAVNATQTVIMGVPILGTRYGYANTQKHLIKALGDFTRGRGRLERANLSAQERKALGEAYNLGLIDKTQAHDLAGVGESGVQYSARRNKWMGRIAFLYHNTELMNREVTYMAAYRMGIESGMSQDAAIDAAVELTWKTHFDYGNCVDAETEALTTRGWLKYNELKAGDRILSVDESGKTVEIGVHDVSVFEGKRDVLSLSAKGKNRNFSMVMTDDHKCVVQRQTKKGDGKREWAGVEFVEARKLKSSQWLLRVPTAPIDGRQGKYGTDFAALLGWIAAEGWYAKNRGAKHKNNVRIEQSIYQNLPYIDEINGILERLGAKYSKHAVKGGRHILWSFNSELSQQVQAEMPDKKLSWAMVQDMNADEMNACLEAFCKADGTMRGENGAWTVVQKLSTNSQNLQVLQAMATMLGRNTGYSENEDSDVATLTIGSTKGKNYTRVQVRNLDVETVQTDLVWCPTTDNGRWIARRNGRVFVTGNTNRPRVMQGDWPKVFLVFRNFQVNMIYRLARDFQQSLKGASKADRREARMQFGATMAMFLTNAGIKGTPLYGIAMLIAGLMSDDGEPEEDMKRGVIEFFGPTWYGEFMSGVALNGLWGHVSRTSLSERIGLPDLWFRSPNRELDGGDTMAYWLEQAAGASIGIGINLGESAYRAMDGHPWRGIESAAPKFVRDVLKAARYSQEGLLTYRDDPVLEEVSPYESFVQAIGFTPAAVAEAYERNGAMRNKEQRILDKRSKLLNRYWLANRQGDDDMVDETIDEIMSYNDSNPDFPITPETVQRSMQSRQRYSQQSQGGVNLNRSLENRLRSEAAPTIYR